ncbi:MAG: AEC family transporter [Desulfobulbaceae bacterium]
MSGNLHIITVLLPVFFSIILGFVFSRAAFPGNSFWEAAERLTYYVLFPSLLVQRIAAPAVNPGGDGMLLALFAVLGATILTWTAMLLLLRPLVYRDGPAFTSVYQGTVRFNSYIGISIVLVTLGEPGIVVAAMLLSFLIPLVNFACIAVLVRFGRSRAEKTLSSHRAVVRAVLTNPVVIACLVGLALHHGQVAIPQPLDNFLDILGRASLPLGLLAVGAALEPRVLKHHPGTIMAVTLFKLLLNPLLIWFFCHLFAVPTFTTKVAVIFAALPGSALSTILARQLGGDAPLVAGITTAQIMTAAATLPLVLYMIL